MASAIAALAIWPSFMVQKAPAASFTPEPVMRDYQLRDQFVAFYEREVRKEPGDQIKMRMLAQQYLARFREQFDMGDIARARHMAERSLELQPQGNTSAQMSLASALIAYHDFRGALAHERAAWLGEPFNQNAKAQMASIEMELGRYDVAKKMLDGILPGTAENPTVDSVRARYAELTGDLSRARALIDAAATTIDSGIDNPAYDRSWYHFRAAQLAYEAGDFANAQEQFNTSLAIFPDNALALMWEAKMYRSEKQWSNCLTAATRAATLYPLPQALGYEADAERALGQAAQAQQTDALIGAEQQLSNVQGVNDRLLANYYAQRHEHLDVALRAAESDRRKRGDEIYADDTLAWTLAALGRWDRARAYAERAVAHHTQDAELEYHAAIIALNTGHRDEGKRRLRVALQENANFDPVEADDARARLTQL